MVANDLCLSYETNYDIVEQWFLNLLEVPNPASFMRSFTEPFVEIENISANKLEPKVNYASVAHKISLFKENEENMNSTEKHNSINIHHKSMRFMLLHFRNNSRNAWLDLGECHSHVIFTTKSVGFYVYHCRKGFLAKISCNKRYEYLKSFLSKKKASYDLVSPKR